MNLDSITITLPGIPIAKKRPRFSRCRGKVKTYNSQAEDDTTTAWQLKARMGGCSPLSGALKVEIEFVFKCPKTRLNKGEVYHIIKPDADNLIKRVLDCGNGVVWEDDKIIAHITAVKRYGERNETKIVVTKLQS